MLASVTAFLGGYAITRVADQGLADTLGLDTLRHGTNPLSWVAMHILGGLPQLGDSWFGGDYGKNYSHTSGNFFFYDDPRQAYSPSLFESFAKVGKIIIVTKSYAGKSTLNLFHPLWGKILSTQEVPNKTHSPFYSSSPPPKKYALLLGGYPLTILQEKSLSGAFDILGIILGMVHPTIKFRWPPECQDQLAFDPSMGPIPARSTNQWVPPLNIGLLGTLWNSLTYKTPFRMVRHPYKVVAGIAQLTLASAAYYYGSSLLTTPYRTAILAGAILGVL